MSLIQNKENEIIKKLDEILTTIKNINFLNIPFTKRFIEINSWDDKITMTQAITDVKKIKIRFIQWSTISDTKYYMKICLNIGSGEAGNGQSIDKVSGSLSPYFAIVPLCPKASADIYVDNFSGSADDKKSITSFNFKIYINKATDISDVTGTEISASNPVLMEIEFFH